MRSDWTAYAPAERSIWAVDAENATRTADLQALDVEDIRARIVAARTIGGYMEHDHTILGVSHRNRLAAGLACPKMRLVTRSGADGADIAIVDAIRAEGCLQRFSRLVIVSGDAWFIPLAEDALAAGMRVTVVSMHASLSNRWRTITSDIRLIDFAPLTADPRHLTLV
jgi:hypothetical protein